jgi:hypothetical protein
MNQQISPGDHGVILPGPVGSTAHCVTCAPPELAGQGTRDVPPYTSIITLKVFGGEGRNLDGTLR